MAENGEQPIIIKKIKKGGHGHHGGAWKVAYADFVTAMMAFFLMLWLLNVASKETLNALSNYFDPSHPQISRSESGAGGIMGGQSVSVEGAMTTQIQPLAQQQDTGKAGVDTPLDEMTEDEIDRLRTELRQQEEQRFEQAKEELEQQLQSTPELQELSKNLLIDITPEGLRIQLVDSDGKPMFSSGSAEMLPHMRQLLRLVAEVIEPMPNNLSIRGHTDAVPFGRNAGYTNWELSADRANSSRRELVRNNVDYERISNVVGKAAREPLIEENPKDPQNRRISIILLRQSLEEVVASGGITQSGEFSTPYKAEPPRLYERTPGEVFFP